MKIAGTVEIHASHGGDTQKPVGPFNKHFIDMSKGHVTKAATQQQGEEEPQAAAKQPSDGVATPQPLPHDQVMPPWASQLFGDMHLLWTVVDDHIATFREERGRWDTDQSMFVHLTTMVNLIQEGMMSWRAARRPWMRCLQIFSFIWFL